MPLIQTSEPACEPVSLTEARLHLRLDADLTADDSLIGMLIATARRAAEMVTARSLVTQQWLLQLDAFPGPTLQTVAPAQPYSLPDQALLLERGLVRSIDSITYMAAGGSWQTMAAANYTADLVGCPARVTPVFGQIWPITQPQIGTVKVAYTAGYASALSADASADTITPTLWPALAVGDPVVLSASTDGHVPAPLVAGRPYYVQSVPVAGSYKLAATVGGSAIDLTDTGSGLVFIGVIPEGIRQWILLRVGTMYTNREEVAILNRGKVELLPYVDGLLDPYRVVLA